MIHVSVSLSSPSVIGSSSSLFMAGSAASVIELSVIELLVVAESMFSPS